jgi:hypothetical protein
MMENCQFKAKAKTLLSGIFSKKIEFLSMGGLSYSWKFPSSEVISPTGRGSSQTRL